MPDLRISYNLSQMTASRRILRHGYNRCPIVFDGPGWRLSHVSGSEKTRVNEEQTYVPRQHIVDPRNVVEQRFRAMGLSLVFVGKSKDVSDEMVLRSAMYRPHDLIRGRQVSFKKGGRMVVFDVPGQVQKDILWQLKGLATFWLDTEKRQSMSSEQIADVLSRCEVALVKNVKPIVDRLSAEDMMVVMPLIYRANPKLAESLIALDFDGFSQLLERSSVDQAAAIALMLCFPKINRLGSQHEQSQAIYCVFTQESLEYLREIKPIITERFPHAWVNFRLQYLQMVRDSIDGTRSSTRQIVVEAIVKRALAQLDG